MGKQIGRKAKLYLGTSFATMELAAAVRTKGYELNNAPVDASDDDSDVFRELLDEPGQKSLDISYAGLHKGNELILLAMSSSDCVHLAALVYEDGSAFSGNFFHATHSGGNEYNGASTFEGKLQSSGEFSFNAGVAATYERSTTTITVTSTAHGLSEGDKVRLDVTSGLGTSGFYSVASVTTDTFTVTDAASGTTSGACKYVEVSL